MPRGTVKWFDQSKGFGFILPDEGGVALFVHHKDVIAAPDAVLTEGQSVEYESQISKAGPKAVNVQPVDP